MSDWLTIPELAVWAPDIQTTTDTAGVGLAVDAAAAYVERHRTDLDFTDGTTVPADVKVGSLMLAYRLAKRRRSPLGTLNAPGEVVGQVVAMIASDPDIGRLLGIGRKFVFGVARPAIPPVVPPADPGSGS